MEPLEMAREAIKTDGAPRAIGPYSQAVKVGAGTMVFLSGQIPLDPRSGELVSGDIGLQTERVMENLKAVLAAAGLDFSHVVRCGIFMVDLADFGQVNQVYGRYFAGAPPARATVQVAALPRGARIEIEAIAIHG